MQIVIDEYIDTICINLQLKAKTTNKLKINRINKYEIKTIKGVIIRGEEVKIMKGEDKINGPLGVEGNGEFLEIP